MYATSGVSFLAGMSDLSLADFFDIWFTLLGHFYLWTPILFGVLFWQVWVRYVQASFFAEQEPMLLEIKLPREQLKSPKAMELVLNSLWEVGGENTFIKKYWKGSVRPWFSLEFVSLEGEVHFFIWSWKQYRQLIETLIYSHYPNVEIHEVPDYTDFLDYNPEHINLWGCEFKFANDDPYPIKTYEDFGIEAGAEPEEQTDPIAQIIEYLGQAGKDEQIWIQILIRAHKGDMQGEGEKIINDLKKRDPNTKRPEQLGEEDGYSLGPTLTDRENKTIEAIENKTAKTAFDVGIRGLYLAGNDNFRGMNIPGLIKSMTQFNTGDRNGLLPARGMTQFSYPWDDYRQRRQNSVRKSLFNSYRERSYFFPPYKRPSLVMSSEELATIYHFPGGVAQTPTFKRIESKKSEPPSDLPV